MHYILDTGFFVHARYYYRDIFPSLWDKLNEMAQEGQVSSVREVKKEVENYKGKHVHAIEWVNEYNQLFPEPDAQDQANLSKVLEKKEFRTLIKKDKISEGGRCADPFLIARAMTIKGGIISEGCCVVTSEEPAKRDNHGNIQGPFKVPDVCEHFDVRCMTPQEFMQEQKWRF